MEQTDNLRASLTGIIAETMGHDRSDEAPECPDADGTLGCQHEGGHPEVAWCDGCGELEWPCGAAAQTADAVLAFLIGAGGITSDALARMRERHAVEVGR